MQSRALFVVLNQPFLTVFFFSLGDERDWSSTRSCMFVMLASFTTHIHEATSQKKTEIANWVTDGKTAVDRGADVICCCCWFFSFHNILEEFLSVVRQYRIGGVLAHCYQTKVNLYFHVKLTVISFSFDCHYCSFGTMFLMLFWTRVENKLPWVPRRTREKTSGTQGKKKTDVNYFLILETWDVFCSFDWLHNCGLFLT